MKQNYLWQMEVVDGVVDGMVVRTVVGLKVRWVTDEVGLKENGSGVESETKAGTDENFTPLLRDGD
ncbi:CLUMA_CG001472, isoform A [Clunio marinus]|uniref:CLUMA_CG001472, isoform A n=1 Tax=Clunio marinus TaxID=568069 RepID=A0A1J1HN68_9DIPT|nr:CLUMA_CG001472, isoform A [Clunio marinus]